MQIFVKRGAGKTVTLDVDTSTTGGLIESMVQAKAEGSPDDSQVLNFAGKQLRVNHTLGEHNVQPNATIHQSARLRGGSGRANTNPPHLNAGASGISVAQSDGDGEESGARDADHDGGCEAFCLEIEGVTEEVTKIDVRSSDTVGDVKQKIENATGTPIDRLKTCVLNEVELPDHTTLSTCGVGKGTRIHVVTSEGPAHPSRIDFRRIPAMKKLHTALWNRQRNHPVDASIVLMTMETLPTEPGHTPQGDNMNAYPFTKGLFNDAIPLFRQPRQMLAFGLAFVHGLMSRSSASATSENLQALEAFIQIHLPGFFAVAPNFRLQSSGEHPCATARASAESLWMMFEGPPSKAYPKDMCLKCDESEMCAGEPFGTMENVRELARSAVGEPVNAFATLTEAEWIWIWWPWWWFPGGIWVLVMIVKCYISSAARLAVLAMAERVALSGQPSQPVATQTKAPIVILGFGRETLIPVFPFLTPEQLKDLHALVCETATPTGKVWFQARKDVLLKHPAKFLDAICDSLFRNRGFFGFQNLLVSEWDVDPTDPTKARLTSTAKKRELLYAVFGKVTASAFVGPLAAEDATVRRVFMMHTSPQNRHYLERNAMVSAVVNLRLAKNLVLPDEQGQDSVPPGEEQTVTFDTSLLDKVRELHANWWKAGEGYAQRDDNKGKQRVRKSVRTFGKFGPEVKPSSRDVPTGRRANSTKSRQQVHSDGDEPMRQGVDEMAMVFLEPELLKDFFVGTLKGTSSLDSMLKTGGGKLDSEYHAAAAACTGLDGQRVLEGHLEVLCELIQRHARKVKRGKFAQSHCGDSRYVHVRLSRAGSDWWAKIRVSRFGRRLQNQNKPVELTVPNEEMKESSLTLKGYGVAVRLDPECNASQILIQRVRACEARYKLSLLLVPHLLRLADLCKNLKQKEIGHAEALVAVPLRWVKESLEFRIFVYAGRTQVKGKHGKRLKLSGYQRDYDHLRVLLKSQGHKPAWKKLIDDVFLHGQTLGEQFERAQPLNSVRRQPEWSANHESVHALVIPWPTASDVKSKRGLTVSAARLSKKQVSDLTLDGDLDLCGPAVAWKNIACIGAYVVDQSCLVEKARLLQENRNVLRSFQRQEKPKTGPPRKNAQAVRNRRHSFETSRQVLMIDSDSEEDDLMDAEPHLDAAPPSVGAFAAEEQVRHANAELAAAMADLVTAESVEEHLKEHPQTEGLSAALTSLKCGLNDIRSFRKKRRKKKNYKTGRQKPVADNGDEIKTMFVSKDTVCRDQIHLFTWALVDTPLLTVGDVKRVVSGLDISGDTGGRELLLEWSPRESLSRSEEAEATALDATLLTELGFRANASVSAVLCGGPVGSERVGHAKVEGQAVLRVKITDRLWRGAMAFDKLIRTTEKDKFDRLAQATFAARLTGEHGAGVVSVLTQTIRECNPLAQVFMREQLRQFVATVPTAEEKKEGEAAEIPQELDAVRASIEALDLIVDPATREGRGNQWLEDLQVAFARIDSGAEGIDLTALGDTEDVAGNQHTKDLLGALILAMARGGVLPSWVWALPAWNITATGDVKPGGARQQQKSFKKNCHTMMEMGVTALTRQIELGWWHGCERPLDSVDEVAPPEEAAATAVSRAISEMMDPPSVIESIVDSSSSASSSTYSICAMITPDEAVTKFKAALDRCEAVASAKTSDANAVRARHEMGRKVRAQMQVEQRKRTARSVRKVLSVKGGFPEGQDPVPEMDAVTEKFLAAVVGKTHIRMLRCGVQEYTHVAVSNDKVIEDAFVKWLASGVVKEVSIDASLDDVSSVSTMDASSCDVSLASTAPLRTSPEPLVAMDDDDPAPPFMPLSVHANSTASSSVISLSLALPNTISSSSASTMPPRGSSVGSVPPAPRRGARTRTPSTRRKQVEDMEDDDDDDVDMDASTHTQAMASDDDDDMEAYTPQSDSINTTRSKSSVKRKRSESPSGSGATVATAETVVEVARRFSRFTQEAEARFGFQLRLNPNEAASAEDATELGAHWPAVYRGTPIQNAHMMLRLFPSDGGESSDHPVSAALPMPLCDLFAKAEPPNGVLVDGLALPKDLVSPAFSRLACNLLVAATMDGISLHSEQPEVAKKAVSDLRDVMLLISSSLVAKLQLFHPQERKKTSLARQSAADEGVEVLRTHIMDEADTLSNAKLFTSVAGPLTTQNNPAVHMSCVPSSSVQDMKSALAFSAPATNPAKLQRWNKFSQHNEAVPFHEITHLVVLVDTGPSLKEQGKTGGKVDRKHSGADVGSSSSGMPPKDEGMFEFKCVPLKDDDSDADKSSDESDVDSMRFERSTRQPKRRRVYVNDCDSMRELHVVGVRGRFESEAECIKRVREAYESRKRGVSSSEVALEQQDERVICFCGKPNIGNEMMHCSGTGCFQLVHTKCMQQPNAEASSSKNKKHRVTPSFRCVSCREKSVKLMAKDGDEKSNYSDDRYMMNWRPQRVMIPARQTLFLRTSHLHASSVTYDKPARSLGLSMTFECSTESGMDGSGKKKVDASTERSETAILKELSERSKRGWEAWKRRGLELSTNNLVPNPELDEVLKTFREYPSNANGDQPRQVLKEELQKLDDLERAVLETQAWPNVQDTVSKYTRAAFTRLTRNNATDGWTHADFRKVKQKLTSVLVRAAGHRPSRGGFQPIRDDFIARFDKTLKKWGFSNPKSQNGSCVPFGEMRRLFETPEALDGHRKLLQALLSTSAEDQHDLARIGGGDPGGRTLVTCFDMYNGCVYRLGHGIGSYMENVYERPHAKMQAERDRLRDAGGKWDAPEVRKLSDR
jgi:hypothetical protein